MGVSLGVGRWLVAPRPAYAFVHVLMRCSHGSHCILQFARADSSLKRTPWALLTADSSWSASGTLSLFFTAGLAAPFCGQEVW
jgi:hypothetical protein